MIRHERRRKFESQRKRLEVITMECDTVHFPSGEPSLDYCMNTIFPDTEEGWKKALKFAVTLCDKSDEYGIGRVILHSEIAKCDDYEVNEDGSLELYRAEFYGDAEPYIYTSASERMCDLMESLAEEKGFFCADEYGSDMVSINDLKSVMANESRKQRLRKLFRK